jgi:hypothetical protein
MSAATVKTIGEPTISRVEQLKRALTQAGAAIALSVLALLTIGISVAAAQGAHGTAKPPDQQEKKLTPEEYMERRYPQPAKVGDLIGLPVLDWKDSTLGHVRHVVRTRQGKTQLIVSYGGWFGWGSRLVAVPIELVAILGRQIAALDMPQEAFEAAPTWSAAEGEQIGTSEQIRIAIYRR